MATQNKAVWVSFSPGAGISATDVQGALEEVATLTAGTTLLDITQTGTLASSTTWVVDTTAPRTRDLALNPLAGSEVVVVMSGDVGTNNVTLGRNGANIEGVAADLVLTEPGTVSLKYDANLDNWLIVEQSLSKEGGSLTGPLTVAAVTESVYTMLSSLVDASNGNRQKRTLAGNETLTFTIAEGQSVFVTVIPGANTLTLTNVTKWVGGSAPATIEAEHLFIFWSDDGVTVSANSIGGIS